MVREALPVVFLRIRALLLLAALESQCACTAKRKARNNLRAFREAVDIVNESWNLLHLWLLEGSEAISTLKGNSSMHISQKR